MKDKNEFCEVRDGGGADQMEKCSGEKRVYKVGGGAVKYLWDLRVYFYDAGSSRVTVQCGRTTVLQVMNNSRVPQQQREGREDPGQNCPLMVPTASFSGPT